MGKARDLLPIKTSSAWNEEQIEKYLGQHKEPMRISVIANHAPLIVPLWFIYEDGLFWAASSVNAYIARLVAEQPHCGFDVSGNEIPYYGIRGQGRAKIEANGDALLARLADRYLQGSRPAFKQWLLSRSSKEVAIRIEPDWITAWDFAARM